MIPEKPAAPPAPTKEPYYMDLMKYTVWAPFWWCFWRSVILATAAGLVPPMIGWGVALIPWPVRWDIMLYLAAVCFFGVLFYVAIRTYPADQRKGIGMAERVIGRDLDGNNIIGNSKLPAPSPKLSVTVNNGQHRPDERDQVEFDDIPFADRLPELARGLSNGKPFTYQEWGGKGRLFSQPEWVTLTDTLRKKGYIQYRNPNAPNQGFDRTRKGGVLFQSLLDEGERIEREARQQPLPPYQAGQVAQL